MRVPLRVCNSCLQRVIALRPSDILPACCRRDLNNLQASSATHIALSAVGVVQWQPHSRCKCSLSHVQHVVASETEAKHSKWVQSVIGRALSRVYRRASHLPLALFCQCLLLRCLSGISSMLMNGVCQVIIVFFIAVIIKCLAVIYSPLCLCLCLRSPLSCCQLPVPSVYCRLLPVHGWIIICFVRFGRQTPNG